jgi:hypothetical protein
MQSLGEMWSLVVVGGFVVLAVAIAYGLMRNTKRDKSKDVVTEAATRELYDNSVSGEPERDVSPEARPLDVRRGERAPSPPL